MFSSYPALENSYSNPEPTSCKAIHDFCRMIYDSFFFFRFSDVFCIDATSEQTLEMDLKAISPGNVEQSVDQSLRWLVNQQGR